MNKTCEICKVNHSNGTVSSLTDSKVCISVCNYCYRHQLKMRNVGHQYEPFTMTKDIIDCVENFPKETKSIYLHTIIEQYLNILYDKE